MAKTKIRINASALKNSTCFLRFYRTVMLGYKEGINNNVVEFGSAFHLFARRMAETSGDMMVSLAAAREYFKTVKMVVSSKHKHLDDLKLCSVCTDYWIHFQKSDTFDILKTEAGPAVELTFENLYYEDDNYEIYLCGTIDKIGKFQNGCYAIGDYKTTSSWEPDEYFKQYELSCQLRFYKFNLELYARLHPESFLVDFVKRPIGVFIDGVFLKPKDRAEFKRSRILFFKEDDMMEFKWLFDDFIRNLVEYHSKFGLKEPPRDGILNGACGGGYKLCSFFAACAAPDDNARQHILKNSFIQQEYNPIDRE